MTYSTTSSNRFQFKSVFQGTFTFKANFNTKVNTLKTLPVTINRDSAHKPDIFALISALQVVGLMQPCTSSLMTLFLVVRVVLPAVYIITSPPEDEKTKTKTLSTSTLTSRLRVVDIINSLRVVSPAVYEWSHQQSTSSSHQQPTSSLISCLRIV